MEIRKPEATEGDWNNPPGPEEGIEPADDNQIVDQDLARAESYLASGLILEAAEIFERHLESEQLVRVRIGLSSCAFSRHKAHEALSHLQVAAQLDPDYPELLNNMGVVLYTVGLVDEAREQFERATRNAPTDPLGWRNLADLYVETMDHAKCLEACEEVLALEPDDEEIADRAAALIAMAEEASADVATPAAEPSSAASSPEQLIAQVVNNMTGAGGTAGPDIEVVQAAAPITDLEIRPGQIADVVVDGLTAHVDDRGYLIEILRASDDHFSTFGQVYLVGDLEAGTIRAFHKHAGLTDWFFISHGCAKFVLVDDRPESPTRGNMMTVIAGDRNPSLITVPPGVFHGWMALADDTQMISTASKVYDRENPDEVRISPDSFGDVWAVKGR